MYNSYLQSQVSILRVGSLQARLPCLFPHCLAQVKEAHTLRLSRKHRCESVHSSSLHISNDRAVRLEVWVSPQNRQSDLTEHLPVRRFRFLVQQGIYARNGVAHHAGVYSVELREDIWGHFECSICCPVLIDV